MYEDRPLDWEPILEGVCLPPFFGSDGHDDLTPFLKIISCVQPGLVVELGTGYGNLTANICRVAPCARVYTVNAPKARQSGVWTTFALSPDEIGWVYRAYGYASRVTQIIENTLYLDLSLHLPRETADLAVIDACHDREYVLNDFRKVEPFVRGGGLVLFHDTHPSMRGHLAGSYSACMALRREGYDIRHIRGTWWAVWQKPPVAAEST